jgi:CheY-like chemotaxis protein/anti-sigma regulatory factor (Ser/Thr protein kinase)
LAVVTRTQLGRAVRLDRAKYKQVLLNLMANAVKFTPSRGEVEIAVENGPEPGTFVTRVRDTGIGIAPEDLTRIFEDFRQLETGTTRRFAGIGLGLAFVRRLVELMGGTISAQSAPGAGATFTVTLPMAPKSDTMATVVEDVPPEQLSTDPIVLAIDDDPEVIALLRDSLSPAHYRVVGALNGVRGLELARILKPFAITLDIMMPEKDGWQVLHEIKDDPTICDTPVIIMSIVSERALGFSLGVTDYLVKPVDRRVLISVLDRLRTGVVHTTALVVDEDRDARTLMTDLLESLHVEIRTVSTAREAVQELRAMVPTVLFLALTLNEPDVAAVLDEVANDPRYQSMRVVLVTHGGEADARSAILESELVRRAADRVIRDGSRPENLMSELRSILADVARPQPESSEAAADPQQQLH